MLPRSIKKVFLILVCTIIFLACCACKKKEIYTLRSWLSDLALKAGISDYQNSDPYFSEISEDDSDFGSIQSLVEWGVIEETESIEFDAELTRDFVAHTVAMFLNEENEIPEIDDLDESIYPTEMIRCVQNDIIPVDKGRVFPLLPLSKEEAQKILNKVFDIANNRLYPHYASYKLVEGVKTVDDYTIIDENHISSCENLQVGQIIRIKDEFKEVIRKDQLNYQLVPVDDYTKIFSELHFSGSDPINFENTYVEEMLPFEDIVSIYNDQSVQRMGFSDLSRVVEKNGFRISYSLSLDRLRLYISKKNDEKINSFFSAEIDDIRPSYCWNYSWGQIKNAYFKVGFSTSEELGLSRGRYYRLQADFSDLDPSDIVDSTKKLFKDQKEVIDGSFTLFKIHVPIQGVPFVELTFDVKVNIYLSGRIELVLDSDHQLGVEINNNRLRSIAVNDFSADGSVNATASAVLGLAFNLEAAGQKLVNLGSDIGVKAKAAATLHIYDTGGKLHSYSATSDYDLLSDIASKTDDIRVCGDLSLSWILRIKLNSADTLASKMGLSKEFDILDEDDQIFGNLSHIEDGMFVEKCTRKDRLFPLDSNDIIPVKTDAIVLDKYSIVLREASTDLIIKSLPDGYDIHDLCFDSENDKIAVAEEGKIIALSSGVTKIRIYTSDQKYEIYLNVLVSYD